MACEFNGLDEIASGNSHLAAIQELMTTTTICLINQKGGCGKSSTCFHLAGHFALQGRRVLLTDADPQGSLSQGFFGSAIVETLASGETLAAIFDEDRFAAPHALLRQTSIDGVSLVPANQSLAVHNRPEPETAGMQQYALRTFLEEVTDFDMLLIDCPPNLYQCSWNALVAADFVLVPVPPEDFGTQGLRVVHQAIEHAQRLNPTLELLGHLVTRADRRLLVHRSYEHKLRELYGDRVLTTVVPEAAAFKVALARRTPVTHDLPTSTAARVMHQLGAELEECIAMSRLKRRVA